MLLSLCARAYGAAAAAHRRYYILRPGKVRRLPKPVVCVGNLTAGGAGKTPAVEWLCRLLLERGLKPAILSRGYGERKGAPGDEALVLAENLSDVPHVRGADRYATGLAAIESHAPDALVLDDGFQHWKLARDFDLVLIDALDPFGGDRLLPAGRLREPPEGLARAHGVLLTRSDLVTDGELRRIRERVAKLTKAPVARAVHRPLELAPIAGGSQLPPESLKAKRTLLASAVGNPRAFEQTVRRLGGSIASHEVYRDHHRYTAADAGRIAQELRNARADLLVVTQKDAVKLRAFPWDKVPAYALKVRLEVDPDEGKPLVAALEKAIRDVRPANV